MDFIKTQHHFTAHLRNPSVAPIPSDVEPRRMAIYKDLIYSNLEGFIANAFPVVRIIFSDDDWHEMIRDFIIRHTSETPLFHEIAREFLNYLKTERDEPNDPVFLSELAHYEWVELALTVLDETFQLYQVNENETVLDTLFTTSPLAWTFSYSYPVHQISDAFQPTSVNQIPSYLLIYRNSHDNVTFIELNPVSARLIDLLKEGYTASQSATIIAKELHHTSPDVVINGANVLISDWLQRGILIKQ
jgi:hypothetical protein